MLQASDRKADHETCWKIRFSLFIYMPTAFSPHLRMAADIDPLENSSKGSQKVLTVLPQGHFECGRSWKKHKRGSSFNTVEH